MAIATKLPEKNVVLRFPPERASDVIEESYQLLEIPAEILKSLEKSNEPISLTIKGRPSDDAVLCTPSSTFLLRTVGISNSLMICRPPVEECERDTLEIRDISHELLECLPQAANLERIRTVLKESAWGGLGSDPGMSNSKKRKRGEGRRWTRAQLDSVVQASEGEIERGLRERNVVELDGHMLLLPVQKLVPLLSLTLTLLLIHTTTPGNEDKTYAPTKPIIDGLAEHDLPKDLGRAVLDLFGKIEKDEKSGEEIWEADITRMVMEVGKGLLDELKGKNQESETFMYKWRDTVGDTWADVCAFKLLEGEHLLTIPEGTAKLTTSSPIITPFPLHSLPLQPAIRFSDLFLTRSRWRPEDMTPFLKGLYRDGDSKERDKLITKFVRVVKEKEETWWYPRRTA